MSSSKFLEFLLNIYQILTDFSDVMPFVVLHSRKLIFFSSSLGVIPGESGLLYLLTVHDKSSRKIAIYNDDYKVVAYPRSILHKFVVAEMVGMIHFERFSPRTMRKLYARCMGYYRVLRMTTLTTFELDVFWNPRFGPFFISRT